MITYDKIRVAFDDFVAIPELDLTVNEGEFFTLLGPSGCGKSTALRVLAGFINPESGRLIVDGRDVTHLPPAKRGVGMVFQNYALFPSMSVWENIAFGLRVRRQDKETVQSQVNDIARKVDLSPEQLDKNLTELSGGQQQRVAIARALVLKPKILLLDEPLSNLDAKLRQQLRVELKTLQSEFGITTIYVTHDQDEALTLSDRIAVFNKGQIEQVGTPREIYEQSATEFVCNFIGESSRLSPSLIDFFISKGAKLHPGWESYIRLEKVHLDSTEGAIAIEAIVQDWQYHGFYSVYTVSVEDCPLRFISQGRPEVSPVPGDRVTLHLHEKDILQYPAAVSLQERTDHA